MYPGRRGGTGQLALYLAKNRGLKLSFLGGQGRCKATRHLGMRDAHRWLALFNYTQEAPLEVSSKQAPGRLSG
jgi:hypothetical protein